MTSLYTLYICVVLTIISILLWLKRKKFVKQINIIPGFSSHFLMGNIFGIVDIFKESTLISPQAVAFQSLMGVIHVYRNHQLCRFWLSVRPLVFLYKPESIKELLTSTCELDKPLEYNFLDLWLADGLLTGPGHLWKPWRKLLTPTFHSEIIKNFLPIFNKQSVIMVEKLKSLMKEAYIDIVPLVSLCTLDIICETVMGVKIKSQTESECQYEKSLTIIKNSFLYRAFRPWLWPNFLYFNISEHGRRFKKNVEVLHDFTKKVIEKKREQMMGTNNLEGDFVKSEGNNIQNKKRKAFLDLLLEFQMERKEITDRDICKQVDTFTFAGHDTTAAGISWTIYCIGLYPEIQSKIQEELDAILVGDTNRSFTIDDLADLPYLERVLKESLRLYPPVPIFGRHLREDCKLGNYVVPKGTSCYVFPFNLHRDPEIYPNPEKFDPDRFLPENTKDRPQYSYIPFSAGPRNCIGQRLAMLTQKCVIANLLRHIRIESLDPRDRLELIPNIILLPSQGLRVKISARNG